MSETVTETPAGAPVIEGQAEEIQTTETQAPAVETPPETPPAKPWVNRRIDDLTRQRYDAQRRAEAAEQEAARLRDELQRRGARPPQTRQEQPPAEPPAPADPVDQRAVDQRAQELLRVREFNNKCNEVYRSGKSDFADYDQVLENFNQLGGLQPHVIEAVLEADEANAHKILYDLGKDPDAAYELLNETNPFRLTKRVLNLSQKYQAPPKPAPISKAPPPPAGGVRSGAPAIPEADPDKMTTAQWMEWRRKNKKVR